MNKTFITLSFGLIFSLTSFANDRRSHQIKRIQNLTDQIKTLALKKLYNKSNSELLEIEDNLRYTKKMLLGSLEYSTPEYIECSANLKYDVIQIQKQIEYVARDTFGMMSYNSKSFAGTWIDNYPCEFAQEYISNAKALRIAARDYLGMMSFDSRAYAKENADKLCPNVDIITLARKYFTVGKARGMMSFEAKKFAETKIKEYGFLSCDMPSKAFGF